MMLANGVEKVFYHIWTATVNRDSGAAIFLRDSGAPRKIAAAHAAMCYLLGSSPRCTEQFVLDDARGYVFEAPGYLQPAGGEGRIAVLWATYGKGRMERAADCEYYDTCGAPLASAQIELSEAPVFVHLGGGTDAVAALRRAMQQAEYE